MAETRRRRTVIVEYEVTEYPMEVDLSVEATIDLLAHFHDRATVTDKALLVIERESLPSFPPAPGDPMACTYRLDPDNPYDTCSEDADHHVLWADGGIYRVSGEAACPAHRDPEEWATIFTGDALGLAELRRVRVEEHPEYAGGVCTFRDPSTDEPTVCGENADLVIYLDGEQTPGPDDYAFDMACPEHSSRRAWTEVLL